MGASSHRLKHLLVSGFLFCCLGDNFVDSKIPLVSSCLSLCFSVLQSAKEVSLFLELRERKLKEGFVDTISVKPKM